MYNNNYTHIHVIMLSLCKHILHVCVCIFECVVYCNGQASSLIEEIKGLKEDINRLKQEVKKRDGIIASLKTDIEGLKKEIQERDDTIQDKEKRIYDLKKKNQELEKFKFVLDYKIKELRRQMEPRENEIKRMKEQIRKVGNSTHKTQYLQMHVL